MKIEVTIEKAPKVTQPPDIIVIRVPADRILALKHVLRCWDDPANCESKYHAALLAREIYAELMIQ